MRNLVFPGFILLAAGTLSLAQQPPTTAPADVPVERLDSPFSLVDRVNRIVQEREADRFKTIAGDMGEATNFLTKFNTSQPVQPQQAAIIGQLDFLIEELEKQKKSAKAGFSPSPSNPLPDSAISKGNLQQGPGNEPGVSSRLWGQLPPKERERILQSQNEGFPAGYESILSSYYRRLAQESVTAEPAAGAAPAPTTQP